MHMSSAVWKASVPTGPLALMQQKVLRGSIYLVLDTIGVSRIQAKTRIIVGPQKDLV